MVKQRGAESKVARCVANCNAKVSASIFRKRTVKVKAEARKKAVSARGDPRLVTKRGVAARKTESASGSTRGKKSEAASGDSPRLPEGTEPSGSSNNASQRQKVRLMAYGVRMWVKPSDKDRAGETFEKTRQEQQSWGKAEWRKRAYEIARSQFQVGKHGGARDHGKAGPVTLKCDSAPSTANQSSKDEASGADPDAPPVASHGFSSHVKESDARIYFGGHWPTGALSSKAESSERVTELVHATSSATAEYDCSQNAPVMLATAAPVAGIPFTPQPVAMAPKAKPQPKTKAQAKTKTKAKPKAMRAARFEIRFL